MKTRTLFIISVFLSTALAQNSTYLNTRYGYLIAYPDHLMVAQGESEDGDGQTFQGAGARLEVWASQAPEVLSETLETKFEQELTERGREVTYQVLRDDWFVVSGYEAGQIFYQKTFVRDGLEYTFVLTYLPEVRGTFDGVVSTLEESFSIPE
jgi:hypothetical protein